MGILACRDSRCVMALIAISSLEIGGLGSANVGVFAFLYCDIVLGINVCRHRIWTMAACVVAAFSITDVFGVAGLFSKRFGVGGR